MSLLDVFLFLQSAKLHCCVSTVAQKGQLLGGVFSLLPLATTLLDANKFDTLDL